jgi:hypothetical protein
MKNTIASLQLEVATNDRLLLQTQSQQHPKLYADFSSSSLSAPAPLHSLRPKGDLEEDQCLQDALRISQMEYHFPVGPVGSRTQLLTLPIDQSLSSTTSSPLIPTAYPADHMDKITQFASIIKQDSQIQAFALSQVSTTVYPVMANVVSSDSTTMLSSPPITGRRLQPTQVNLQNKRQHFPTKVHNYFVQDDYPPLHPCEEEFLDNCIIQHCCRNNIMMQLPLMSEDLLQHLRRFQTDNLLQHKADSYVASSLLLEVMVNFVENACVIRRSTIPFAGDGLFLLPGKSFQRGLLLPCSGTIQSGTTISSEALLSDDKYVCLRPNIYLKGSDSYTFPITGTTYPPYLAKANELVCSNMHENNHGKIINSGMVLFDDGILGSPSSHTEVFVLYSPLLNSYQALIDEPPHRTLLKKQVLPFMFDHLDDCFLGTPGYMSLRPTIRKIVRQIKTTDFDINSYRKFGRRQKLSVDKDVHRYFEACVSVVDGRFKEYLQHVHPNLSQAMTTRTTLHVDFQKQAQCNLFLPEAILIHAYTWFYYGNYHDKTYGPLINEHGSTHHKHLFQYMCTNKVIITSPARVLQLGIPEYKNLRFPIEDINSTQDVSPEDDSVANSSGNEHSENDDVVSFHDSSSFVPSNIRSSSVHMSIVASTTAAPPVLPQTVVPSCTVQSMSFVRTVCLRHL